MCARCRPVGTRSRPFRFASRGRQRLPIEAAHHARTRGAGADDGRRIHQANRQVAGHRPEHRTDSRPERAVQARGSLAIGGDQHGGPIRRTRYRCPVLIRLAGPGSSRQRMTATLMRHPAILASRRIAEPAATRSLVLYDYVTFAEALARRLDVEPGMRAFAATTIEQARRMLTERRFDILLLDVEIDGHDGLRFADEALSGDPNIRIVVVTADEEKCQVVWAVWVGVSGWVPKNEPIEHLLAVVRGTLRGETWIPPLLLTHVLAELKAARRYHTERDSLLAN